MKITLVGIGGIGGHLARNVCHFLHAARRPDHVVLVDGDAFEEKNRDRMRFGRPENKAIALARELASAYSGVITVEPVPEYVTQETVVTLVGEGDVVLSAVDNHATRRLLDARCAELADVVLVSGGNDGIEGGHDGTYGNVQVVRRERGRALTASLTAFHPEITDATDYLPTEQGCLELAQNAPQLLVTNVAVASAMLSAFWALVCRGTIDYEEVYVDVLRNRVNPARRPAPDPGA